VSFRTRNPANFFPASSETLKFPKAERRRDDGAKTRLSYLEYIFLVEEQIYGTLSRDLVSAS